MSFYIFLPIFIEIRKTKVPILKYPYDSLENHFYVIYLNRHLKTKHNTLDLLTITSQNLIIERSWGLQLRTIGSRNGGSAINLGLSLASYLSEGRKHLGPAVSRPVRHLATSPDEYAPFPVEATRSQRRGESRCSYREF